MTAPYPHARRRALLFAGVLTLVSCGGNATEPSIAALVMVDTPIANAIVAAPYSHRLQASGGARPYSWSVVSGSLPVGLDLDASTGEITGVPTAVSQQTFTVAVTSADGQSATATLELSVFALLEITTDSLPSAVEGSPYDVVLAATGGDNTHTWTVTAGALPTGLSLDQGTGEISGAPTATGSSTATFQVSSGDGQTAQIELALDVFAVLTITTSDLANAVQDVAYADTLHATGGDSSNTWSLASGALPSGLVLDASTGVVSGTPTTVETQTVTVEVASGDGQTAQIELHLSVYAPLVVATSSLATGIVSEAYADTLKATGGDGAHTWAFVAGSLPDGLSLDPGTGEISGTPTATGSSTATFQVSSGDGQVSEIELDLVVHGVLTITTSDFANAVQNVAYADTLHATGGDGSNTWSLASGALPSGLVLDASTGVVSGAPTAVETQTVTVQVASGDGQTRQLELHLSVYAPLVVTTSSLAVGIVSEAYADTLKAMGGDGAHAWTVATGSLPAGLTLDPSTGEISGTPTAADSSTATFRVSSGDGQVSEIELALDVFEVLSITTSALANAIQNVAYADTLHATGGDGSYAWSLVAGGLPSGLSLEPTSGAVSGTPTTTETATFTVHVASGDGQSAQLELGMSVYPLLDVTTTALGDGVLDAAYADTLEATGGDGAHSWSIVAGTLPSGLSLDSATGEVSGTPAALGSSQMTFEVASGDGQTAQSVLSITVNRPVLTPTELCSDYPSEAVVTFEDTHLETAVRAALGIGVADTLTCALTAIIPSLDARSLDITALAGIQNLTSLGVLYLDGNSVADLSPLGTMTALHLLSLQSNLVSDLGPLSGLTGLTDLIASGNAISDLTPLQGLVALEQLFLQDNSISDLGPLSGLTNLQLLWVGTNSVSNLAPLAGLTGLGTLFVGDNSVTDVSPLTSMTGLTSLDLRNNPIGDVTPVGGLTGLQTLHLGQLGITDIGFLSGLTQLALLDLYQDQVSDLSPLSGLTQLTSLHLYGNQVTDVSPISGLTGLETLWLAANAITDIDALAGLTNLAELSLASNGITDVTAIQGMTALTRLLLDNNPGLADIQPLIDNTGLGTGDQVSLEGTSVSCTKVGELEAKGATVTSDCP